MNINHSATSTSANAPAKKLTPLYPPPPSLPLPTPPTSPSAPRSAVPLEGEGVAALPGGPARGTDEVVGAVALLAEATVLAAGGGEAAALAVLHDRLGDPLDAGVVADGGVGRVHRDHLQRHHREQGSRSETKVLVMV